MSKEIVVYAGAIAHERGLTVEQVFDALSAGIAKAMHKQHGDVTVTIDAKNGAIGIIGKDGHDLSDEWGRQDAQRVKMIWSQVLADLEKTATKKNTKKSRKG